MKDNDVRERPSSTATEVIMGMRLSEERAEQFRRSERLEVASRVLSGFAATNSEASMSYFAAKSIRWADELIAEVDK